MQTTNIMVYIISYAMVFALSCISRITKNHRLFNDEGEITQRPGNLLGIHLTGIMWLGLVPLIQVNLPVADVFAGKMAPEALSVLIFGLVYLTAIVIASRLGKNIRGTGTAFNEMFSQLSHSFFKRYFIIRALYLSVYELWFRGFLLFESIKWLGIPAAISLNIFLYTMLHIFKSKKEILACIPFGFILCFLSIFFNAAWPAIILHTGFSLVYEITIYRNYINSSKTVRS